jgi:hypothetical protein
MKAEGQYDRRRSPLRLPDPSDGTTSGAESLTGGGTGETWSWKPLIRAGTLSAGAAGPPVHLRRLTARKAKMIFVA